jgi:formate--tetrahydrofolate ligase
VVTEAGFGADLGAEKFFDIKCRQAGLRPSAAVIVASIRALKMNGGVTRDALAAENLRALSDGLANLGRHVQNMRKFGVPIIVAINHFATDTAAELALLKKAARERFNVEAIVCRHWAEGAKGAETLAHAVAELADNGAADFKLLYPDDLPLWEKAKRIAVEIYGASDISASAAARRQFLDLEAAGYNALPVCVAKTPYSFSADPRLLGAPSGHVPPIRELRLRAGAGFVVAIVGDVMTMPGLPRRPAAERIGLRNGVVEGLF